MLIVTGIIEVGTGDTAAMAAAARDMVAGTVVEAGCHGYEFSQDVSNTTRFRVYEEWEDQAALDAHALTPHMATFRGVLGGLTVVSREIASFVPGPKQALG
ncbi:MAG: quinol monooxygenase YgiN [Paracoccaceae bacterium]|jgi:quinol monooxygenase YgiN